jgi:segregation and condensation protein B
MAAMPDPEHQPPEEQGISLRELRDAFARATDRPQAPESPEPSPEPDAMGMADEATDAASSESGGVGDEEGPALAASADIEDHREVSPLSILEAMLFVGNQANTPLTGERAAELMRGVASGEIPDLVDQLNQRYATRGCPYHVVSEGGGYAMALRREYWPVRNRFYGRIREARLSQAAIEVLAVVAYRQPITAEDVSQVRSHPASHLLTQLVRRRLLRIERSEDKPRVARYCTTPRFLELFGLDNLNDLPRSDEDSDPK